MTKFRSFKSENQGNVAYNSPTAKYIYPVTPPEFYSSSDLDIYMQALLFPPSIFLWVIHTNNPYMIVPDPIDVSYTVAVTDTETEPVVVYFFNNEIPLESYVTPDEFYARPRSVIAYGDVKGLGCYRDFLGKIGISSDVGREGHIVGKHRDLGAFQYNEHGCCYGSCYEYLRILKTFNSIDTPQRYAI